MQLLNMWNIISYTAQRFAALREKLFVACSRRSKWSTAQSKSAGTPPPQIPSLFFSTTISLNLPHDLKALNRLSCLPSLHNYLVGIDGIVPQILKKSIGYEMVILLLIFKLTVGCFSLSSRLFRYQIASVSCCVYVFLYLFLFFFLFFGFFVCVFDRDVRLYFLNIQCKLQVMSPLGS